MRPHPKIRKTVKWGGAVASVLLAVVWVGSVWYSVLYANGNGTSLRLGSGQLQLLHIPGLQHEVAGFRSGPTGRYAGLRLWFVWAHESRGLAVFAPLWLAFVPLLAATALAWRLDRRARQWSLLGICAKCGYDRAGIAAGAVCPECGAGAKQ